VTLPEDQAGRALQGRFFGNVVCTRTGIPMTSSASHEQIRSVIGDQRLKAFFRAACGSVYPPRAIKTICKHLDSNKELEQIIEEYKGGREDLELDVKQLEDHLFEITFGFRNIPMGDGGIWKVGFGPKGDVTSLEQPGHWIERH
jgi:hypothetical protein